MSTEAFAKAAVDSIYFKDSEAIISKDWYHYLIIWIRNIWPDLIFKIMSIYKIKELKNLQEAN